MCRVRCVDHLERLELDVPAVDVLKHASARTEQHRHQVDADLIDEPGSKILLTNARATHHADVLVVAGGLRLQIEGEEVAPGVIVAGALRLPGDAHIEGQAWIGEDVQIGAGAQLIMGKSAKGIDWTLALVAGLVGSFVGGLLISLLSGDGLQFRASGLIGSLVGALLVTAGWQWYRRRSRASHA